jgi:membrane protein
VWRAFLLPIPASELLKRTWREVNADNCLGLAAQLAYYFALALFPALIFVVALASYFPRAVMGDALAALDPVAPPEVVSLIRTQLDAILAQEQGGLLTIGVLGALWSSSAAVTAVIDTLNRAYDIEESRPWWKVRLTAIGLTVGLALFILTAFTLVVAGPELARSIAGHFGLGGAFALVWTIVQWPIVFALVAFALALVYYFAPDAEQDWVFLTPGSVLSTVLWLLASIAFRYYVQNFGDYTATYGALGGAVVLLLWLYVSGLVVLVGGELNAEIEHASPAGKEPGEKRPGQRKRLRAFSRVFARAGA